jgi:hypothetical protein
MIIKCISLWQPWAWAMWENLKRFETRGAHAPVVQQLRAYRGWLGIQAAKKPFDYYDYPAEWLNELRGYLTAHDIPSEHDKAFHVAMHYGCIGGICWFDGGIFQTQAIKDRLTPQEVFWGDYSEGRRAIHCKDMTALEVPIPVRGSQGLFDWHVWPEVEDHLRICEAAGVGRPEQEITV